MDTSKTRIKMRVRAIPDLGMGTPRAGPPCFVTDNVWVDAVGNWYCSKNVGCEKDVVIGCQLERQDQLQEMAFTHVDGTYNKLPTKVFAFADYWEENGIPTMFTSLEQLWLAFVMKEKYNKIWSGEDWVLKGGINDG